MIHRLTQYGQHIELDVTTDPEMLIAWANDFEWQKYNPRKDVNRWGLSVTSSDGTFNGIDLDSLYEYNKENKTSYNEKDFNVATPVLNKQIHDILLPWDKDYYRTHFLKFGPGGFFPPHRDWNYHSGKADSFRLIMPLRNVNPPYFNFVLEDKTLHWEPGRLYFVDTLKMHYLFNSSFNDSYWLIVNVDLNPDTIQSTLERMNQK
jgi:hypothetical protein|tara:strand:- start:15943 stop:16557 length:615 start_codon:yes stop_codon:yes gene_type:complete